MVGHRGAGHLAPENTLLSFQKAIEMGCQRTELDVWLTSDGQVVVFHDKTLSRLFPGNNRRIENLTLAEIKALDLQEQKIPTLQEVIDLCRGKIKLQIELKGNKTPKPVNELIVKNKIEGEVLVTSFNIELLKEIKKINPALQVGLLFDRYSEDLWTMILETPLDYICPKADIVFRDMIGYAHALDVKIYAYHANEKDLGLKLASWNIDDIGTDIPDQFLPFSFNEQKMEKYERELSETFRTL